MITGALPAASNFGTWIESVEVLDAEDNQPIDFSIYDDIVLEIIHGFTGSPVMSLSKICGNITTPAPGIIEWRAEGGAMSTVGEGTYKVNIYVKDNGSVLPVLLSSISIVG